MKVFSKKRFIELEGKKDYKLCKGWVDECDGKQVTNFKKFGKESVGICGTYLIPEKWCVEVEKEEKDMEKKYTVEGIKEMFKKAKENTEEAGKMSTKLAGLLLSDSDNAETYEKFGEMWEDTAKTVLMGMETVFYGILEGEDNESK